MEIRKFLPFLQKYTRDSIYQRQSSIILYLARFPVVGTTKWPLHVYTFSLELQMLVPIQNLLILCFLLCRWEDFVVSSHDAKLDAHDSKKLHATIARDNSVKEIPINIKHSDKKVNFHLQTFINDKK